MYLTAAAGTNVALNLALIPVFGLMGAAAATLAANVILVAVLWHGLGARLRTLPAPVDAAGS
jgi:O-antigen/teichoic acid export membrane protein